MYSLKQGFEEFLASSGMETKINDKAKMLLKQAWMAGASCVLKEYAKAYNKDAKQAPQMMQSLGKDAHAYDQYKDDAQKQINKEIDSQIKEEGHNPIGFGGLFGYPMGWGYGNYPTYYGGGFPSFWNQSLRIRQHDDRDWDRHGWDDHKHRDWHDRHHDGRMYGKDYVDKKDMDARPMREKYPDVEARNYYPTKMQQDMYPQSNLTEPPMPEGKVYSQDGRTYTYQGHTYYADGRLLQ